MELCRDGHEEVCYDRGTCPVCSVRDELSDAQKQIQTLESDFRNAELEVDSLQEQLDRLSES